jgi:hypothetical protein
MNEVSVVVISQLLQVQAECVILFADGAIQQVLPL